MKLKITARILILAMLLVGLAIFAFIPSTPAHIKCPEGITLNLPGVPNPFVFTLNANGETYTRTFTHDEFTAIINQN